MNIKKYICIYAHLNQKSLNKYNYEFYVYN